MLQGQSRCLSFFPFFSSIVIAVSGLRALVTGSQKDSFLPSFSSLSFFPPVLDGVDMVVSDGETGLIWGGVRVRQTLSLPP